MTHIVRALVVWALLLAGCVGAFVALWQWSGTRSQWLDVEGPDRRRGRLELDLWSALVENTAAAQAHFAAFMRGVSPEVGKEGIARPGFDWDAPLDGPLRRDKLRQSDPPPLGELTLHEWVIAPSEPVVLMGRYSAARGGLVHDDRTGRPLRVLKGDMAEVQRQLRNGALAYGVLSLVALAVAALLAGSILGWHDLGF